MTKKEIKINLTEILYFIKFAVHKIPIEHYSWDSEKYDWIEALNEAIKMVEQEQKSPCDLCRFNPPSSCDGKPCTMCPAQMCQAQATERFKEKVENGYFRKRREI